MMHKAWSSIEEVPYCFSRSSVKFQGHTALKSRRFRPKLGVSGLYLQLEFTDGYERMHTARSSIVEVPYCFSRSSVKFQGHTALKIVEFDPDWAFPDCNSSLNSPMAMKCCTKLETAKERCPIVFQGHTSNFKVTRYKASPILTQIGRFRTIGQSQLSNPSDLPCLPGSAFWNLLVKWQSWTYMSLGPFIIWVRSRNWDCLVTWFCYQLIAKPGNKTAPVSWLDPNMAGQGFYQPENLLHLGHLISTYGTSYLIGWDLTES